MNISTKAVLASALLVSVIAGTSANAGRAELSTVNNGYLVSSAQKVYLENTSGGKAEEVIAYIDNSVGIKKVSFKNLDNSVSFEFANSSNR